MGLWFFPSVHYFISHVSIPLCYMSLFSYSVNTVLLVSFKRNFIPWIEKLVVSRDNQEDQVKKYESKDVPLRQFWDSRYYQLVKTFYCIYCATLPTVRIVQNNWLLFCYW